MRLDLWLVQQGHAPTRNRAQHYITTGLVCVNGERMIKSAYAVIPTDIVTIEKPETEWVSRAAQKLLHGLEAFSFNPEGRIALDIGASTGGFTEVLLKKGAAKVYAVEVGHGQLHSSLHNHPRIVLLEGTNARNLNPALIPDSPTFITCDASFISLKLVLPAALALAKKGARLIALIKPQFEVGKGNIGKGVVKDEALHRAVCDDITNWLEGQGWKLAGLVESPVHGQDGNKEFLAGAIKQ